MADVNTSDIAGYAQYLKAQGVSDSDIHGYTQYLSGEHGVDHPSESNPSWLDNPVFGGTPRGYIKGALNALPAAGTIAGGVIGAGAGGPVGAVGGAGLGAAAGESLKNLGEGMLGEDKTRQDIYLKPVGAGVEGATAEMGGQVLGRGMEAAANTSLGRAVLDKTGKVAAKVASTFSGVPEKEIATYAKNAPEIKDMIANSGGDHQELADQVRNSINDTLKNYRGKLNDQISTALKSAAKDKTIDVAPIIEHLEAQKTALDPNLHPEAIKDIDQIVSRIKGASTSGAPAGSDGAGLVNAEKLHEINKFLQDQASPAYGQSSVGFQVGDQGSRAAKGAAAIGRQMLGDVAPHVASANSGLSKLHQIEDVMNKNMLADGKPAASLFSAGSDGNAAGAKVLRRLGDETGSDMIGQAEKLAAARRFADPSFMPADHTGKSLTRMGAAGLIGGVAGYEADGHEGAIMGALAAEGLASPAMIKLAIDSGMGGRQLAQTIMTKTPAVAGKVLQILAPYSNKSEPTPGANPTDLTPAKTAPEKGPDKWANDGLNKLIDHSGDKSLRDQKEELMNDPKAKKLLISASDLKPGSKAMDTVLQKLKTMGDKK